MIIEDYSSLIFIQDEKIHVMKKKEVIIDMTNQLEHRFSIKRVVKTSDLIK